jgi:hypothetical protein
MLRVLKVILDQQDHKVLKDLKVVQVLKVLRELIT